MPKSIISWRCKVGWATPPPPMIKSCHLQAFFLNTYRDCCDVYYNSTKKKEAMSTPIKYTKFWLK